MRAQLKTTILMLAICSAANAGPPRRMIFSEPENLLSVSSNRFENFPHVSKDGLRIYFASDSSGVNVMPGLGEAPDIYMSERSSIEEPFRQRQRIGGIEGQVHFLGNVSDDELEMHFLSFVPGGAENLYVVSRDATDQPFDFDGARVMTELGHEPGQGQFGHVSTDGLRAYSNTGEGAFVSTRQNDDQQFAGRQLIATNQFVEYESTDQLVLFSWSPSAGGEGNEDLFMATRSKREEEFGAFINLGPVINSPNAETFPYWHEATSTLYFTSDRDGTIVPQEGPPCCAPVRDVWQSQVSFAGDFDFDGELSIADIDMLTEIIRNGAYQYNFDNNRDEVVDDADRQLWINGTAYANTYVGDANLDGNVDFPDFLALSAGFGGKGGWADGDFDGNGQVEFPDFLALSANFGESKTAAASVPEPSSLVILLLGLVAVDIRRRLS